MMSTRTHFFVVGGVQRSQGNRIKIQAHHECRRHDTPAKPRVQWGQSPIWNPGYTRTKSNIELRRSGTITRAFVLRLGSAAPLGLYKCVPIINPGFAPWAMQEYRPYRASLRLPIYFIILMRLPCKGLCVLPHFRLEKNACKCLRVCFLRVSLADSIIICNFVLLSMLLVVRFTVAK